MEDERNYNRLMNKYRSILFIFCILLSHLGINAQNYRFVHYNNRNGLLNNLAKACIQDSLGYIWVATDKGLSRFDGLCFENFNKDLPSNYIKAFYKTRSGRIMATTDLGLIEITSRADTAFTKLVVPGSLKESDTTIHYGKLMYEDTKGSLWIADLMGIGCLKGTQFKRYRLDANAKSDNYQRSITLSEDGYGNLYAFSINGYAYYFDTKLDQFIPIPGWKCHPIIYQAIQHEKGCLLLACSNGIYRLTFDAKRRILEMKCVSSNIDSYYMTPETANSYLVGTLTSGLHRLKLEQGSFETEKITDFPFERINHLFKDRRENVWVSTDLGIYLSQPTFFKSPQSILSQKFILSVRIKDDGEGLISSYSIYTSRMNRKQLNLESYHNLQADGKILYAEPSKHYKDCWWFTSSSNVVSLMNKKGIVKSVELPTTGFPFFCSEDKLGNVWFCIRGYNGVIKLGTDFTSKTYNAPQGLPNEVINIRQNALGEIYASGKGDSTYLFRYNSHSDRFENVSIPLNFEHKKGIIASDLAFNGKTVWIASTEGVLRYENGKVERLKIGESTDNNVYSVAVDKNGILWFANNTGVFKFENNTPLMFNENSGLSIITASYRCMTIDKDNNIWLGTSAGLNFADNSRKTGTTPPPLITKIEINKEKIQINSSNIHITKGSYITFKYVSLCYPGGDVSYQYKLEGQDQDWNLINLKNEIVFPALPVGKYVFKVKARLLGNYQWSEATSLEFEVVWPWYLAWYSILGYIFTLGLIVYGVIKINTFRLAEEKEHLEKIVQLRTEQIQQKNTLLEQQNIEITAQKNEIERKNKNITDSITYASRIQQAVLPTELLLDVFPSHFVLFKPRDIVSGDFYFAKMINNIVIIAAVDCTGHGVPGAFMSILGSSLLSEIVVLQEVTQASMVLNLLRDQIKSSLKQTGRIGEQQDGMDISFCVIDMDSLEMQYSGANSPLYLLRKQDPLKANPNKVCMISENGYEMTIIKPDHMPIGVHPKEEDFTNHNLQLQKGDVLYLFSDGYQSQFGGSKGDKFKVKRLKEILLKIQGESMESQKLILEKTLADWQGERPQVDDILLMGIKI